MLIHWVRCFLGLLSIAWDVSTTEREPNDSECNREVGNKRQGKGPRAIDLVLRGDYKWDNDQSTNE